jgi:hypothetical protein
VHRLGLCCQWVLANTGCARMMLRVVGCGVGHGALAGGGVCERRVEGRRVRAENWIGAAGEASLGPSLVRMTQLTSLDLGGTLRDIGWACAVSGCLRTPAMQG